MGHSRTVKVLMEKGADPTLADKAGKIPAQLAENMNVFNAIVEGTEVAKLRARVSDMRDEICSLRGVVEALREENDSLRAQADELHDAAEESRDDVAEAWRRANAQTLRERQEALAAAIANGVLSVADVGDGGAGLAGGEGGAEVRM